MGEKIVYNKLVRDQIPEVIQASGKSCHIEILDNEAYLKKLNEKLIEECNEWLESGDIEELADLLEVIKALAVSKESTYEAVEGLRIQKAKKRGGFEKRLLLVDVDSNLV